MNKIFLVLLLILFASNVYALGITPGRTTFDYVPGESQKVDFSVINSEGRDMSLVVFVQGELNRSISVSEVSFSMAADEASKGLYYSLEMPSGLSPGLHTSEVVVVQLPEKAPNSEAFVGGIVGVATQIHLFVPYPGKYAEAELNIIGPDASGQINFVIPIHSRGDLNLVRVRGIIDIYGALNEKITTINTNEVPINSQERKEIVATWKPDLPPGTYRAVATVLYDEKTLKLEKQFNIGFALLEIIGIDVNDFSLGEIAKFELLVENKWSQMIQGAYAQMLVYNTEGEVMADFKSATYDIPALEKGLLVAFWDTEGVGEGTYDSSLLLNYAQQSARHELKLEVSDNDINVIGVGYVISSAGGGGGNTIVIVLSILVGLLILINLVWFLVLRKRLKK